MNNAARHEKLGKDVNKILVELTSKYENDTLMEDEEKLALYSAIVQTYILGRQKELLDKVIQLLTDNENLCQDVIESNIELKEQLQKNIEALE